VCDFASKKAAKPFEIARTARINRQSKQAFAFLLVNEAMSGKFGGNVFTKYKSKSASGGACLNRRSVRRNPPANPIRTSVITTTVAGLLFFGSPISHVKVSTETVCARSSFP